jgi:superfamily II DNA or RNA helicase
MNAPTLRPYQEEAIAAVRDAMAGGARRVLLHSPTGSGKTVMGAEVARKAGAFVTVVRSAADALAALQRAEDGRDS